MKDLLRDNWLWFMIPVVLIVAVVLFLVYGTDGGSPTSFGYEQ